MIRADLPAPFTLVALDEVGSTNDEARRLALSGAAADFVVVTADRQTAGRGRRGREWISPRGNLHCSVLIRLGRPLAEAAQLGFAASLALCQALEDLKTPDPRCKWPNDVLVQGRKAAGMLLEPVGADWLILGVGVDVVASPPPGTTLYGTTSLAEAGVAADAGAVLAAFCARLGPWVECWRRQGFAPVRTAWLAHAKGLGEPVVVRLEAETLTGTFSGLDDEGALMLEQPADHTRRVLAGDIFFPGC